MFGLSPAKELGGRSRKDSPHSRKMAASPTLNHNSYLNYKGANNKYASRNGEPAGMISINLNNIQGSQQSEPSMRSPLARSKNQTVSLTEEFGGGFIMDEPHQASASFHHQPYAATGRVLPSQNKIERRGPIQDYSEADMTNTNHSRQSTHRLEAEHSQHHGKQRSGLSTSRKRTKLPITIKKTDNTDLQSSFKMQAASVPTEAILSPKLEAPAGASHVAHARRQILRHQTDASRRGTPEHQDGDGAVVLQAVHGRTDVLAAKAKATGSSDRRSHAEDRKSRPSGHAAESARSSQFGAPLDRSSGGDGQRTPSKKT